MEKFFDEVAQIRKNTKGATQKEVDEAINEAVQAAKAITAKNRKIKANA